VRLRLALKNAAPRWDHDLTTRTEA